MLKLRRLTLPGYEGSSDSDRIYGQSMTYRVLMSIALLSSAACAQVPTHDRAPLRVVILFQQSTVGSEPSVLARLKEVSGAGVRFAAAVSEREYAYWLACPPSDPACQQAIAALASWPGIERISADQIKRIQP